MNIFIIHGAYGHPEENWFGWLKRELNQLNIDCCVPHFPTPDGQNLEAWLDLFNTAYNHLINEKTIMIGHSLGAVFTLKWLEQTKNKISTVILAGAFLGKIGIEKFDRINESFFSKSFDWEHIRNKSNQFFFYHGSNDPYVPQWHVDFIARHLNAIQIIIANAGHLNAAAGYSQFKQLLIHLKQIREEQ